MTGHKKVDLIVKLAGHVGKDAAQYIRDAQQISYVVDQREAYLARECYL